MNNKFKRLTEWENGTPYLLPGVSNLEALKKLAEMEDKIQKDCYIEAPVAIGDVLYHPWSRWSYPEEKMVTEVSEITVTSLDIDPWRICICFDNGMIFKPEDIGIEIFYTEDEARKYKGYEQEEMERDA